MKKLSILFILIFSFVLSSSASAAEPIQVTINDVKQAYDQPPIIENSRTLVPLRGVFESLGATVNWNSANQEITAVKGKTTIWLKIGSKNTKINDSAYQIDVPAKIKNGRTLVPLRFVSEALGAEVNWVAAKSVVEITTTFIDQESLLQFQQVQSSDLVVTMKTSKGDIKIKLFPEQAPKAVENFITHSQNNYYDNLTFHRVINDFMIQGGDPLGNGTGGESIWGAPFTDEFSPELAHFNGAVSMANSGSNTNGSQFFIVQAKSVDVSILNVMKEAGFSAEVIEKYKSVGGTPWLDNRHTVFGQVIEGLAIVNEIAAVDVDAYDMPITPIYIKDIIVKN